MAFDKNSNGFTFGFAIAMVVVVGAILSLAAMGLKPFQKANMEQEKKQNILAAISVNCERSDTPELFDKYVKEQIVLNMNGEQIEGDAFAIDIKKQYREVKAKAREESEVRYPLYVCQKGDSTLYVIPVVGTGLWGPIWGFVALQEDLNTIYGATFDHKTETPGLGAEINTDVFEKPFRGDMVYEAGAVKLEVMKGGGGNDNPYGVDGITGGTITSKGVEEMLQRTLAVYQNYFATLNS